MKRKVKSNDLVQLKEEFLKQKQLDGIAQTSIDNYRISIEKYLSEYNELTQSSVDDYKLSLMQSGLSSSSVNHYLRELRTFVNWAGTDVKISLIKAQEDKIKFYTDEDIKLLLEKPNNKCSYTDYRTWVTICFIMATGARASTVINIQIDDIDFISNIVTYSHTKNKKSLVVPLTPSIVKILKDYINEWDLGNKWLFCDRCGNKMTVSALRQSIDKLCIKKGIEPKGVHALRHTFARMSIRNGIGVIQLQRILGHQDISMTNHYVNLFSEDLRESINTYCPLDNIKQSHKIQRRA